MILRSVMKHVRDQNWFAVGLDFLIVVVGVFIGIQVANWNEARLEDRQERLLIERLVVDFQRIEIDSRQSLNYHSNRLSEFKTLVQSLRAGELADDDTDAIERALFLGLALQTSADRSGTFTELLSSGRAYLLKNSELLNELVAYEDFLQRFAFAQEFLMHMSLDLQQPFVAGFDYQVDGIEVFDVDSVNDVDRVRFDFETMRSDRAFLEAAEQLMYMHTVALVWRTRISERVERIQGLLAETS